MEHQECLCFQRMLRLMAERGRRNGGAFIHQGVGTVDDAINGDVDRPELVSGGPELA